MPCESLDGAWETGTHSRARGGCHVSTLFGSGHDTFGLFLGQLIRSDYIVLKNMFDVVDEEIAR